jgi:hypothetical protein
MRAPLCLLCAAGLLLAGCGRTLHSVADVADNTRTATEQMASASAASSASREVLIYPEASSLRATSPLTLTQRYEMREGPDGFMIYDTESHSIARIGNQAQAGLTLEQAKKASDALTTAASHAGQ